MSFKDDKMEYIEDDIQKIQMKTGMYISYVGKKGALHLTKEAINNAIDECLNKNSKANKISVEYHIDTDRFKVEDNGRGIPENDYPLHIFCTKLNSGSKFTREQGGASAGENGVGLTATNALSEVFVLSSVRNGMEHRIEFHQGVMVSDTTNKVKKNNGTSLEFIPSKKYLGKSTSIPYKEMVEWLTKISYFIPKHITIKVEIFDGMKVVDRYKFRGRTIKELLKDSQDSAISTIITGKANQSIVEDFQGRKIPRHLELSYAFSYSSTPEPYIDSYCNFINTIDGGVHLDTVKETVTRYLANATKKAMTDREKDKMDILWVDVHSGLNLVVNLSTDMQIQFVGQTKNKVSSEDVVDPLKQMTQEILIEYFNKNSDELNQLIKIVKLNAKARMEMTKVRNAVVKEVTNNFDEHLMNNFSPANNKGKQYREIYIVEGDSAKGSAVQGRDPDTQAVFAMRGVSANAFKKDLSGILQNKEWRDLVKILGCNIGASFDINKLRYNKIIILTDADIDGAGITSLISAFFVRYLPELVDAGILYKAISPLYLVNSKKKPFINNKTEYVELFRDNIIKNYKISTITRDGLINMSKSDITEFLLDTTNYSDDLIKVAKHYRVNKFLIETVSAFIKLNCPDGMDDIYKDNKTLTRFIELIQKDFPEITVKIKDNHISIRGVIDGRFQSLRINNRFIRKCKLINEVYSKYGVILSVKEKDTTPTNMTIGRFIDATKRYVPAILNRFKGLGESDPEELWETTLNPDNRVLIQLTFDNVESDLIKFGILHGDSSAEKIARKNMMRGYQINREELDN